MKYKVFLFLLLIFFQNAFSQKKSKSEMFYDLGNTAFAQKDYKKADSLFSLSINLEPHPDTYFNLSACKRKLNDFEGYCINLGGAMNMGDKEAKKLYNNQCIKTDTLKGREIIGDTIIKVIKLITTYLYNGNVEYEKYDLDTNLLSSYYITKSDTIYNYSKEIIYTTLTSTDSSLTTIVKNTGFAESIRTNNSSGKINLSIVYNKEGKIENIKTISATRNNNSENELINELYKLSRLTPAAIKQKPVKHHQLISIIYSNKLMYAWTIEIPRKLQTKIKFNDRELSLKNEEVMPEFPGGIVEMMKYIQKNIKYPQIAKEAGLSGKCFLKFVINVDGQVSDVRLLKGVPGCIECDVEAIRVIYSMPKWKPGMQKGKSVPVFYNLPINFNLH